MSDTLTKRNVEHAIFCFIFGIRRRPSDPGKPQRPPHRQPTASPPNGKPPAKPHAHLPPFLRQTPATSRPEWQCWVGDAVHTRLIGLSVCGSRGQAKVRGGRTVRHGALSSLIHHCPLPLGHCWDGQTEHGQSRRVQNEGHKFTHVSHFDSSDCSVVEVVT